VFTASEHESPINIFKTERGKIELEKTVFNKRPSSPSPAASFDLRVFNDQTSSEKNLSKTVAASFAVARVCFQKSIHKLDPSGRY